MHDRSYHIEGMQSTTCPLRRIPLAVLLNTVCFGSMTLTLLASSAAGQVLPPGSTVAGKSIAEWIPDWAVWAFSEPEATNATFDETGEFQHLNQQGPVWFLPTSSGIGTDRELSFTVPSDRHLLSPTSITWACSDFEDPSRVDVVRDVADRMEFALFSIDGFSIPEDELMQNHRVASGLYRWELQPPSWVDHENVASGYCAVDGVSVMLEPLSPGQHVIHQGGRGENWNDTFVFNITSVADSPTRLQAGDADQDLDFDQLDLVQVQIAGKYLTGQAANWGEGDWDGAPGGSPGEPPVGNGFFDQLDVVAALGADNYLTGPYAAIQKKGQLGDEQTSVVYNSDTGELSVDASVGVELTSINVTSAAGRFVGLKPGILDGAFDNYDSGNLFKATFGGSFGSISFGNVLPAGIAENDVAADLSVVGSLAGGGDLGNVDLVYVPEPGSMLLLIIAFTVGSRLLPRRNR